jgi:hypothetical protein
MKERRQGGRQARRKEEEGKKQENTFCSFLNKTPRYLHKYGL